jgi:hypothetical protein
MGLFDKITGGIGKGLSDAAGNAARNVAERKATEVATDKLNQLANKKVPTSGANAFNGNPSAAQNAAYQTAQNAAYQNGAYQNGAYQNAPPAQNGAYQAAPPVQNCADGQNPTAQGDTVQYAQAGAFFGQMIAGAAQYAQSPEYQKMLAEQKQREIKSRVPVESDAALHENWARFLPQYPVWQFGGYNAEISEGGLDEHNNVYYHLSVSGTTFSALSQYRNLLKENGFRAAGKYPSDDMLYKMVGGQCYNLESCEPFGGGEGCLSVTFGIREPNGGFDYKKESEKPQKKSGFFGLFKK